MVSKQAVGPKDSYVALLLMTEKHDDVVRGFVLMMITVHFALYNSRNLLRRGSTGSRAHDRRARLLEAPRDLVSEM